MMAEVVAVWRSGWIAVTGNTYPLREELKGRKYKWDPYEKSWLKKIESKEDIQKETEFFNQEGFEIHDNLRVAMRIFDICPFQFSVTGKNDYGKHNVEIYIEDESEKEKAIEIAKKIHTMLELEDKGDVCVHCGTKCIYCSVDEYL